LQKLVIKKIGARKILDSRGNPTIEVDVAAGDGTAGTGRAAAPSGASRGRHEVVAFPEGGVQASLKKVEKLAKELIGRELDQGAIDKLCREFDGTPDLRRVGGNAIVAISMAVAKAVASAEGVPLYRHLGGDAPAQLPYPLGNVLGGGEHAGVSAPDIQEFLALPVGADSFERAAFANAMVHGRVRKLVSAKDKNFTGGKGDEGAWAPNLGNRDALEVVSKACEEGSDEIGFKVRPALDVAASSLYDEKSKKYVYGREGEQRSTGEQIEFVLDLVKTYKLVYVEDPIQEDDFESFAEITRKVGKGCLICGDDLFVTNPERIKRGIEAEAANAVLIKPNQVGTLTDTLEAVNLARENGWVPVMSHRSGETPDETIAHLAVGYGCPIIKTGVVGGERVAKLNELIRIEEELGEKARMGEISCK
jgi:enolase